MIYGFEAITEAEASINDLGSDKIALTDETGELAGNESALTTILQKLAGNDVSEISASADWTMLLREIVFENGEKPVSIFFPIPPLPSKSVGKERKKSL